MCFHACISIDVTFVRINALPCNLGMNPLLPAALRALSLLRRYLFNEYGDGQVPLLLRLGPLTALSVGLGTLPRGGRGITYRRSRIPDKPLEIWGYEASPYVKLAREVGTSRASSPLLSMTVVQPCMGVVGRVVSVLVNMLWQICTNKKWQSASRLAHAPDWHQTLALSDHERGRAR